MERATHKIKILDCFLALVNCRRMNCLCSMARLRHDLPVVQGNDPVGQAGYIGVMGHQYQGSLTFLLQLEEQF